MSLTVPKSLDQIIKDLQYLNEHRNAYTLRQLRDTLTELSKDLEAVSDRLIL